MPQIAMELLAVLLGRVESLRLPFKRISASLQIYQDDEAACEVSGTVCENGTGPTKTCQFALRTSHPNGNQVLYKI